MPRLIVLQASGSARQVSLVQFPFSVGRSPDCDLVLDSPDVSRLHAVFEVVAGTMQVRDPGSSNGTLLNGRRIQAERLSNGDQLRLGPCMLRYLSDGDEFTPAQALRLVTIPGKLSELDLQKLAPRTPKR